jgi:hypothetical protein
MIRISLNFDGYKCGEINGHSNIFLVVISISLKRYKINVSAFRSVKVLYDFNKILAILGNYDLCRITIKVQGLLSG